MNEGSVPSYITHGKVQLKSPLFGAGFVDSLFFWISKLAWLFISPDSLLLIMFGLGLLLLWRGRERWAGRILGFVFFVFLLIGLFPVGEWLLNPLEKKYPANPQLEKVDGIIILGGAEQPTRSAMWKQVVVDEAGERDLAFLKLAREFPEAKLLFTGGSSSMVEQGLKGADVAKQLFQEQGLDISSIIFESESRNTWENGVLSKKLVEPKAHENWVLITTAWHMPRSVGIFCQQDWKVIPYPVDYWTNKDNLLRMDWGFAGHLKNLSVAVKEWIGIAAYTYTGKMCQ